MLTPALAALALAALAATAATFSRAAGRGCYRIDRDAYHRAQTEWAACRRAQLSSERSS